MNQNEFKRRLSEFAVWEIPKIPNQKGRPADPNALNKRKTKYVPADPIIDEDEDESIEEPVDENKTNPTLGPRIKAIKVRPTTCDDCGKRCTKGRQTEAKVCENNNQRHWRETCLTCNKARNPYTNKFDVPAGAVSLVWHAYVRGHKQPDFSQSIAKKKVDR
jgi:hypothetical protein